VTVSSPALVKDLQRQVGALEDDLRRQAEALPDLAESLCAEHAAARKAGRTAEAWPAWLDAQVTQAAVAWVLACVFVRFCEDNDLVDRRWLAGIEDVHGDGLARAVDAQGAWIQANPRENERGWLREAFSWLRSTRAGEPLVDEHNPVWRWDVSADAAATLLAFFRRRDSEGRLMRAFNQRGSDGGLDTRFLGDLYQDLSDEARKRYAMLQTPAFVATFILDRTLTPGFEEFGLDGLKLIDPACGSGHLLLGAFHRLFDAWTVQAPSMGTRERVQAALEAVHGVDVNPFAAAIAKFRLIVAALSAEGLTRLAAAPPYRLQVGTGDSLLWGAEQRALPFKSGDPLSRHQYATEDLHRPQHQDILKPGRYHVVVGNPPYITVKDKALNEAYRKAYKTCHRQYPLSVPFAELFFRLARRGDDTQPAGYVGQITSNSFMKREFGTKLIEEFFPTIDLTHVIDSEGAWIPGHNSDGTPTVILIGRRRYPATGSVRTVLSKGMRENRSHGDGGTGPYWQGIVSFVDAPGRDDEWISVTNSPRALLLSHPWSLSGGGAGALMGSFANKGWTPLRDVATDIGFGAVTREDGAFMLGTAALRRLGVPREHQRPLVEGKRVRDWEIREKENSLWPYDSASLHSSLDSNGQQLLWPIRQPLRSRVAYGQTQLERGLKWFEYSMFFRRRFEGSPPVVVPSVATHMHAAIDDESRVFKDTAIVIKVGEEGLADRAAPLAAVLNSSASCFWFKQRCKAKGGAAEHGWARTYQFNGSNVGDFPLPTILPEVGGRQLADLARELGHVAPTAIFDGSLPTWERLVEARAAYDRIRGEMIALQEELDWEVYRLYGILDADVSAETSNVPELRLGERAFEIVLARKVAVGEEQTAWFERHRSTPITEIPAHWPAAYRDLVERRIKTIEEHPLLHLVERPECKRRWASRTWEDMQADALRGWVLDRLEAEHLWSDHSGPRVLSVAQLADAVRADVELRGVLDLLVGKPDYDLAAELTRLVKDEAVPYLAAHRYKEPGLRKRAAWEEVWALQRREDAGETVEVPVPPKYTSADFRTTAYWRNRGKLDVSKERFVLYPGAGRDGDKTPVLGWAGWDHLHQAQALARLVLDRQNTDGWDTARVEPLLAGLVELEPWLGQWHGDYSDAYGGSPAEFYRAFLDDQLHAHGLTRDKVVGWRP
jgi:hypothetical protein